MSDDNPSEILINVKGILSLFCVGSPCYESVSLGPSELKLQIAITNDKTVLELKQAIAEKSDVEADRQRLIYSGELPPSMCYYVLLKIYTRESIKGAFSILLSFYQVA